MCQDCTSSCKGYNICILASKNVYSCRGDVKTTNTRIVCVLMIMSNIMQKEK